jgi:predicted nucleic acid-binding protein
VAERSRTFFDTNVLVYLHDVDESAKRARASEVVAEHLAGAALVVSTQVLLEYFAVVTRKFARVMPHAQARREVERLAELDPILVDGELILRAIDRVSRSKISIWDATIVEAALAAGCTTLYTEDLKDGWEIDGRLRVVNPFAGPS